MKNLYEIMESMNKEEKMWACIRVELNDLRKNHNNFGANEVAIISEYFRLVSTYESISSKKDNL